MKAATHCQRLLTFDTDNFVFTLEILLILTTTECILNIELECILESGTSQMGDSPISERSYVLESPTASANTL